MPKKLERCVRKVKRRHAAVNPYAVCIVAIRGKKRRHKRSKRTGRFVK